MSSVSAGQSADLTDAQRLSNRMVDVLTRVVVMRLRADPDPTRTDFETAARSLDLIRTIDPTDIDLIRRSIEAWRAANDTAAEMALVRELLALDPSDTFSQLRVTLDGLARSQNAGGRLETYDRLLGERGEALDPSVRSRLALDASLLARDNGDDRLFLEYLTLATTLDPTNKEAAAVYAGHLLQLTADPLERVDILCNVILADPLDPSAHENLALELLQYGAFGGALRMFQLSANINEKLSRQLSEDRIFDFALCEWNVSGRDVAIARLLKVLQDTILSEQARRQAIIDDGLDPGPERPMLLPPRLQLLRLAIAASEKSEESAQALAMILDEYTEGSQEVLSRLDDLLVKATDPASPTDPADEAAVEEATNRRRAIRTQIQVYKLQRLWAQLAAGAQLEEAELFLDEMEDYRRVVEEQGQQADQPLPLSPDVLRRYRGWLLVMKGEDAAAEELLAPLVEHDHLARWAMGLLKEEQGLRQQAMMHYAILARDQATTALGTTAFSRLTRLADRPIIRSTTAVDLDKRIAEFAPWLDGMIADSKAYMSAKVGVNPIEAHPLDRPVIEIEIRNTSRWPLGVGGQQPIPRRMLLAPRIRRDGRDTTQNATPIVALLSNRLRLRPSEPVTIVVHPLREDFGRILDNSAASRFDARWQLLQNFLIADDSFKAAPLTITAQSQMLSRVPLDTNVSVDALIDRMRTNTGVAVVTDMLLAGHMILERSTRAALADPQRDQERTMLAAAIVSRAPELPSTERTLAIVRAVELGLQSDPVLAESLQQLATTETEKFPLLASLIGLVWSPDDPIIAHAQQSGIPEIERIATLIQESLRAKQANGSEAPADSATPDPKPEPEPEPESESD